METNSENENETQQLEAEEIKTLAPQKAMALAIRCAKRVTPVLGKNGNFNYWGSDARKYVIAIESTIWITALQSIGTQKIRLHVAEVAEAAARKAGKAAVPFAGFVAFAAADAARGAFISSTASARLAAGFGVFDEDSDTVTAAVSAASRADFNWLKKYAQNDAVPLAFFTRPLWDSQIGIPPGWNKLLGAWKNALSQIDLLEIYANHEALLDGVPTNLEYISRWINEHWKDIEPTEIKPIDVASMESNVISSEKVVEQPLDDFIDGTIPAAQPDRFAGVDRLGRDHLAQVLASMFNSSQQATPFTVAILGQWGAGKSTVMELIKSHLQQEKLRGFCVAEFNAWEYEHTENIRAGLAQEVVKGLTRDLKWRQRHWLMIRYAGLEYRAELLRLLIRFLAIVLPMAGVGVLACNLFHVQDRIAWSASIGALAGMGVFFTTAWKSLRTILEHPLSAKLETYLKLPSYGEHLGQIPVIRRQLETLCKLLIPQSVLKSETEAISGRLIVFVDDLDRCNSNCIIDTLDAVRLVMNVPGTIVVLMMDQRIAIKAVAEKYKNLADENRDEYMIARDYIGKIVQLPIILSTSHPERINSYIKDQLFASAKNAVNESELEKSVISEVHNTLGSQDAIGEIQSHRFRKPLSASGSNNSIPPVTSPIAKRSEVIRREMQDTIADRNAFMSNAELFHLTNPRQLLRLRNSFRVLKGLMSSQFSASKTSESKMVHQALLMLFWLEFLYDLKPKTRKGFHAWIMSAEKAKIDEKEILSEGGSILAKTIRARIEELFGPDYYKQELFFELKETAKLLVLPYHEDIEK
jgi:Cdc6-like AAA superfamily ATPase